MLKALHPRDDADCMSVKGGGRGYARIQDSVDASIQWLEDYIKSAEEDWLQPPGTVQTTQVTKITRKQKREEKQLCVHFKRQTSEISQEKIWTWLRKGNLKRETESLLIAAQNNTIKTTLKQKQTRRNKIGDVGYLEIERRNNQS